MSVVCHLWIRYQGIFHLIVGSFLHNYLPTFDKLKANINAEIAIYMQFITQNFLINQCWET